MSLLSSLIETMRKLVLISTLEIPLEPAPASRPRVTGRGTFYVGSYADWKKKVTKVLKSGDLNLPPHVPLTVFVESICTQPRTSKKFWPKGDVDNFAKGPLDAVTQAEGYWYDDDQLITLVATKRWALPGEQPRTILEIYR